MKTKFYINSWHLVEVDDYSNGCVEYVNEYTLNSIIEAETWQDAVNSYFKNVLHLNPDNKVNVIDEDNNIIMTSCLVGEDNQEPSKNDVELWENGEKVLYCNSINIEVKELKMVYIKLNK